MKRYDSRVWLFLLLSTGMQGDTVGAAEGYEVIEVREGGMISGEVTFVGTLPVPEEIMVLRDREVCGKEKINEALQVGPHKGIQNVVVSILNIQRGKQWGEGSVVEQKECRYIPRVAFSPVSAELTIVNSDGILHHVLTESRKNLPIDQAHPGSSTAMKAKFLRPEIIKITCDIHHWMTGWLVIQPHPYYEVTDATGAFQITDVPPGDYELKFWHETLGEVTRKVSVNPNQTVQVMLEMAKK